MPINGTCDQKTGPLQIFLKGGGNHLLRNDNGKFVDVTKETGIHKSLISFGLGVTVGDVNGDGIRIFMFQMIFLKEIIYISIKKTERLKMNWNNGCNIPALLRWVPIWAILTMMAILIFLQPICCPMMIIV